LPKYHVLVKFSLSKGVPLFNALVPSRSRLNSGLRNLVPRNQRHRSMMRCRVYFDIMNRLGVTAIDRRIDRRRDIPITNTALNYIARRKKISLAAFELLVTHENFHVNLLLRV